MLTDDELSALQAQVAERDALLREARDAIYLAGYGSRMGPEVRTTLARIDASLCDGPEAKPSAEPKVPLLRGTTGRCTRRVCDCESLGLGPQCVYLEPAQPNAEPTATVKQSLTVPPPKLVRAAWAALGYMDSVGWNGMYPEEWAVAEDLRRALDNLTKE